MASAHLTPRTFCTHTHTHTHHNRRSQFDNATKYYHGASGDLLATLAGELSPDDAAGAMSDGCDNTVGGFFQLLLLLVVYGAVLFKSADVLSEGSELLMFVPSIKDVVGSIVLPILGAVPDGAIVLFSGMGPIQEAQEQLNVGVGALAGSTIMLLTIPWFLSLWAGRVDLVNGSADTTYKRAAARRLTNGWSLTTTGVSVKPIIKKNAYMMLATGFPCYLIIQIPAFVDGVQTDSHLAGDEHPFAVVGLVLCVVLFAYYLYFQAHNEDTDALFDQILKRWLNGEVKLQGSLSGILCDQLQGLAELRRLNVENNTVNHTGLSQHLIDESLQKSRATDMKRLRTLIKPIFRRYDKDHGGSIDKVEFFSLMQDLNESAAGFLEEGLPTGSVDPLRNGQTVEAIFNQWDTSHDGTIDFDEFCNKFYERAEKYALKSPAANAAATSINRPREPESKAHDVYEDADGDGDDDNEEEEMPPKELIEASGEINMAKLKKTAATSMFFGTLVVLLFSDPMVDVLSALGHFINIKPFYISFVLAPLASNASELVASMNYASKRTKDTITTSLSTLLGAANMNNTFCLGIFFALIVFRNGLKWTFSAETISILLVEVIMFFFAIMKNMQLWSAFVVLSFFPLSVAVVAFLESDIVGME